MAKSEASWAFVMALLRGSSSQFLSRHGMESATLPNTEVPAASPGGTAPRRQLGGLLEHRRSDLPSGKYEPVACHGMDSWRRFPDARRTREGCITVPASSSTQIAAWSSPVSNIASISLVSWTTQTSPPPISACTVPLHKNLFFISSVHRKISAAALSAHPRARRLSRWQISS